MASAQKSKPPADGRILHRRAHVRSRSAQFNTLHAFDEGNESVRLLLQPAQQFGVLQSPAGAKQLADAEAKRAADSAAKPTPAPVVIDAATVAVTTASDAQQAVIAIAQPARTATPTERDKALAEAHCESAEEAFRWILLLCTRCADDDAQRRSTLAQIALIAEANLNTNPQMQIPLPRRQGDEATRSTRVT